MLPILKISLIGRVDARGLNGPLLFTMAACDDARSSTSPCQFHVHVKMVRDKFMCRCCAVDDIQHTESDQSQRP